MKVFIQLTLYQFNIFAPDNYTVTFRVDGYFSAEQHTAVIIISVGKRPSERLPAMQRRLEVHMGGIFEYDDLFHYFILRIALYHIILYNEIILY